MDTTPNNLKQRTVRGAVALGAAALLVAGATWHGSAAEPATHPGNSTAVAAQSAQTPAVSRGAAIAGGRDSYADIVKTVAPAVVTIQVEGRARVEPTQFNGDDEDMLRRFFGEQFGQGRGQGQRQMPRAPRQRGLGS